MAYYMTNNVFLNILCPNGKRDAKESEVGVNFVEERLFKFNI